MTAAYRERVVEYLTGHRREIIRLLEVLTRAESPSSVATAQVPVKCILADEF